MKENTKSFNEITDKIIATCKILDDRMNEDGIRFSSENAFVFDFAWQLSKQYAKFIKNIDFEVLCYEGFGSDKESGGKYLDLQVEFKNKTQITTVGFEFKYPKKGGGGTRERRRIIHDLKRINWLVAQKKIDVGVLICATDYNHFMKKQQSFTEFQIYPGKEFRQGEDLPKDEKRRENYGYYPHDVQCQSDIKFNWSHLNADNSNKPSSYSIKQGQWSFLDPIIIAQ